MLTNDPRLRGADRGNVMSQPITGSVIADLLDALNKTAAAATVRWSEIEPGRRFESEVEALRVQLAAAEAELQHATDENDRLVGLMCARCKTKVEKAS